ncbi:MAG: PP2C family protein-serine/threonine phosphatase [Parasporobacterium sp.]|nr:PP2C family protein-serine/threonine phosphatase [Parasporobacterium sp.]
MSVIASVINATRKNEKEANRFSARCMLIIAGIGAIAWFLNYFRVFNEPVSSMTFAMSALDIFYIIPIFLCRIDKIWVKYVIMLCSTLGICFFTYAIPAFAVIAFCVPMVISCHYYCEKLTWITLLDCQVLYSITAIVYEIVRMNATPQEILTYSYRTIFPRIVILLGIAVICVPLAKRTEKLLDEVALEHSERERLGTELNVATRIQSNMLPSIFPYLPEREEFDIFASMNPAKEVGGDFYDFFMVDQNHLALVMADVSGKGVPAALFMVIAKTLIKNVAQQGKSAAEVLNEVNRNLCENNKEEMFVTVWIGILDINTGVMQCANAGHEFPAIRRKGGQFELFKDVHGLVLAGMEFSKYRQYEIQFNPGDTLFVYTDGVPEATNSSDELFGTDRMVAALNKSGADCKSILECIKVDVDAFVGEAPQFDDLTMLAMNYRGVAKENV